MEEVASVTMVREIGSIGASRATGATMGALLATAVITWLSAPPLAAALLFCALTLSGRSIGAWSIRRHLENQFDVTWDHVTLLQQNLRSLGVPPNQIAAIVHGLVIHGCSPEFLNDPKFVFKLISRDFLKPPRREIAPPSEPALEE